MNRRTFVQVSALSLLSILTGCFGPRARARRRIRRRVHRQVTRRQVRRGGVMVNVYALPDDVEVGHYLEVDGAECEVLEMNPQRVLVRRADDTELWLDV